MKRLLAALALLVLVPFGVLADFSDSQIALHPALPGKEPFIIEITGTWSDDCHPGEQKPVVESFDGHTVEIDFEIIVIHVNCNNVDTPYRVLVDMSETLRTTGVLNNMLDVRVNFDGAHLQQALDLECTEGEECPGLTENQQRPRPGLYEASGLKKQGLLVTRQNNALAIFPLAYNESGGGVWLISGNHMVHDSFFAEILRPQGGDCFGCELTDATPELSPAGYVSILFDRPGKMQVKVDDGLFTEYTTLTYGYGTFAVGPSGEQTITDIEGRWGISENRGNDPVLSDLTGFFPGAFDIYYENYYPAGGAVSNVGQVYYLVSTPIGETLGQLVCKGQTGSDDTIKACEFIDPTDAAEPLFMFYQQGPTNLSIEYGRAFGYDVVPPGGVANRLE